MAERWRMALDYQYTVQDCKDAAQTVLRDAFRIKNLYESSPRTKATWLSNVDQTFFINRILSARAWMLVAKMLRRQ